MVIDGHGSLELFETAPMNAAGRSQLFVCSFPFLKLKEHIKSMSSTRSVAAVAVVILGFALSQTAFAGELEFAGFGGGTHLRADGEGTTKGVVGGRIGASASKRVLVFGEYSYAPLAGFGGSLAGGGTAVASDLNANLMDFSGGVHVNLAPGRVAPYVLGALGVGRLSASGTATVGTTTASFHRSDSALGASGGIGLRYFVGRNWGIQPEFRYTRYFFDRAGLNDFRFAGGLFFRFGE